MTFDEINLEAEKHLGSCPFNGEKLRNGKMCAVQLVRELDRAERFGFGEPGRGENSSENIKLKTPTREQITLIEAELQPTLVVAGAGSGKTESMAYRIAWLVANQMMLPGEIVGITFTNKAVNELRQRVKKYLALLERMLKRDAEPSSEEYLRIAERFEDLPTVMTYNSFSGEILREFGVVEGIDSSQVIQEAERYELARQAVEEVITGAAFEAVDEIEDVDADSESSTQEDEASLSRADEDELELDKWRSYIESCLYLEDQLKNNLRQPSELGEFVDELTATGWFERLIDDKVNLKRRAKGVPEEDKASIKPKDFNAKLRARKTVVKVLERFQELKKEKGVIDFGDQVYYACKLLEGGQGDTIVSQFRGRYSAVILDEYQDTSAAQCKMLQLLFARSDKQPAFPIMAVGDPNQSIYSWRGASDSGILRFHEQFKPAKTLSLSTSWRNPRKVLEVANKISEPLFQKLKLKSSVDSSALKPLGLSPLASDGELSIELYPTLEDEVKAAVDFVESYWFEDGKEDLPQGDGSVKSVGKTLEERGPRARKLKPNGKPYSAAVISRVRNQFNRLKELFEERGIPVEVVGLSGLLELPEVSDILSLLWIVADGTRDDKAFRLLVSDRFGLSRRELAQAKRCAKNVSTQYATTLQDRFPQLESMVSEVAEASSGTVLDQVVQAIKVLGVDVELIVKANFLGIEGNPTANLDAFLAEVERYQQLNDNPTLQGFLEWTQLVIEREDGGNQVNPVVKAGSAVQLITIHSSKGLEWDAVASIQNDCTSYFPERGASVADATSGDEEKLQKFEDKIYGDYQPTKSSAWLTKTTELPYPLRLDYIDLPGGAGEQPLNLGLKQMVDMAGFDETFNPIERAEAQREFLESRRLAYVAFTRSGHALQVSASWSKTGKYAVRPTPFFREVFEVAESAPKQASPKNPPKGSSYLDFLRAKTPDFAELNEENSVKMWPSQKTARELQVQETSTALARDIFRRLNDPNFRPAEAEKSAEDARELRQQVELVLARLRQEKFRLPSAEADLEKMLPPQVSPSQLIQFRRDPEQFIRQNLRPIPERPFDTAEKGTLFHSWVQHYFDPNSVVQAELLNPETRELVVDTVLPNGISIARLIAQFQSSEWADPGKLGLKFVAAEKAFRFVEDGRIYKGVIDAVFRRANNPDGIAQDGIVGKVMSGEIASGEAVQDEIVIVDWKTGNCPSRAELEKKKLQLAVYRAAILREFPGTSVSAAFWFADLGNGAGGGKTVRFEPEELEKAFPARS